MFEDDYGSAWEDVVAGRVSRRELLRRGAIAGLSASAVAVLFERAALAASTVGQVSFASFGGSYNDNITAAFIKPFQKKTGIKVNLGAGASLSLAKLQAKSSSPQWDIVELPGPDYEVAVKQKMLLPLDYRVIRAANIPAAYKRPYGIKYALFLFVMAWDRREISDAEAPKTWAQFFDTKRYPGKRSLYQYISDGSVLEAALLADGVPMNKLYPLDVERALRKLDNVGRDNIIWHTGAAEPIQQLTSGEVVLATSYPGRIVPARRQGAKIGFTATQGAVSGDYLPVIKRSDHVAEAFKLIDYIVATPKANAKYMGLTNYATPNTAALKLVPLALRNTLPTSAALKGRVFVKSDAWWAANLERVNERFEEWRLG